jgi:thiamine-monophosphate kinase
LRNETEIIERIWRALPTQAGGKAGGWLRLGVGDDAAVIRGFAGMKSGVGDCLLSTDAFLEGVHFLPEVHSPGDIGYKALARATSDLAAMGASPRFFLLGLAMPADRTGPWLDGFLKGVAQAAREFGMVLIGGDTSRFHSIVMNITVGGSADGNGVLTRAGAQPGDLIFVSGALGAAQLGLDLILHGPDGKSKTPRMPAGSQWKKLLRRHLRPKIQIGLGRWLAGQNPWARKIASAAIDTSDGLSADLNHICEASGVGARIWAARIPTVRIPKALRSRGVKLDSLELALHGGEDYQLLFAVPPKAASMLPQSIGGTRITEIGVIVPRSKALRKGSSRIELVGFDGTTVPLPSQGWDPFSTGKRARKKPNP